VQALDSVAAAAGNQLFKQAIEHMRHDVSTGMPLNRAMAASGLFPGMAIQMTAIGEESGTLEHMLEKSRATMRRTSTRWSTSSPA